MTTMMKLFQKKEFKPRPLVNIGFANLGQWEKHTKVKLKIQIQLLVAKFT